MKNLNFVKLPIKNKVQINKKKCICQICICGGHKCHQFKAVSLKQNSDDALRYIPVKERVHDLDNMQEKLSSSVNKDFLDYETKKCEFSINDFSRNINGKKWNISPENLQQVASLIENKKPNLITPQNCLPKYSIDKNKNVEYNKKKQNRKNNMPTQSTNNHNDQLNSNELKCNEIFSKPMIINRSAYFVDNSFNNNQEWLVAKQLIQKPKDHDFFNTMEPCHMHESLPIEADIRKQELIEKKCAQEKYRKQLDKQIEEQKPFKSVYHNALFKFKNENNFETENKKNYVNFKIISKNNENSHLLNCELENEQLYKQTPKLNLFSEEFNSFKVKSFRPQSSLTSSGKFKENLYLKEFLPQQKRHFIQIDNQNFNNTSINKQLISQEISNQQNYNIKENNDENNNSYSDKNFDERNLNIEKEIENKSNICEHCKNHLNSEIKLVESSKDKDQSMLNMLAEDKCYEKFGNENTELDNIETSISEIESKKQLQRQNSFNNIPRYIQAGKKKPHKNMSHLKFEGTNSFLTTNNLMYRNNSLQNLISIKTVDEDAFDETIEEFNNNNQQSISGNIRGKVKDKYRDLFASSEDIFNTNKLKNKDAPEKISGTKCKSMYNLNLIENRKENQNLENKENFLNSIVTFVLEDNLNDNTKATQNSSRFERKKTTTLNSCYGAQLECPALELTPDKYIYNYSTSGHKYFSKVNFIN